MRTMHLFAGHGGGLLADLILRHKPIVAVEWDGYACQVLRERAADGWFPGLRVWEWDIRLFDPSEYAGEVDCIHAGFPCQDISVAGKQAGLSEGTRSGLYREVLRVAGIVKPRQIFLENVSAILSNGLGTVLADLAAMGYDCRWLCIRASDVGAPHHRDRWFLLADSGINRRWNREVQYINRQHEPSTNTCNDGEEEFVADSYSNNRSTSGVEQNARANGRDIACWSGKDVADAHGAQRQGVQRQERIPTEYSDVSGSSWWEVEPGLGRVANGVPHRIHRLKGLGNAQVPLQAAIAYRLLGG